MKMKNIRKFLRGYSIYKAIDNEKNIQKQTQNIDQNADTKVIASRTIYSGPLPLASGVVKVCGDKS